MFKKPIINMCLILMLPTFTAACNAPEQPSNDSKNPEETPAHSESDPTDREEFTEIPNESLQKKDSGEKVKQLQLALNEVGYELNPSGDYDETTTWAITDFQLQHDTLLASGIYDEPTKQQLEQLIENKDVIKSGEGLPLKAEPAFTNSGTEIIANPYDQLGLINKEHALPEDYIPEDLVIPDVPFPFAEDLPKKQMRQAAAAALEELFQAAEEAELELFAQSGYRSYERQDSIFAANVQAHGEEAANNFSARPGESEHQSGLTMDVTSPAVDFDLVIEFGETEEGKWIKENAADYGFIIRYPEGKEDITIYQFEPWHLRYVGVKAAKEIMSQAITLEEYLEADK
ncbi:D-alanyl-D-alanine carboxypeptidase family protein [Oceanobacillus profundus]|uniref:Carboxypeptidase n=1 Tax=Oceanobacillus profundus TaxID=372463 RepID=A0A417YEM8_9BACI|nr:D-alanyl-D-alanine carboxypeptidase family protein [Oceanobacillus profundus]MBR3118148.1 D-alanyl-D-alanine carboxypeptidase family protein [Oceanobacillus sp.]PAE28474.1 carboxypeptidase [Paenibacillus sp. 7884-2]MCM3398968.1 D-alanyl-D-alanine carboxypeptidase family protein [Oceanobacillus profundus]MDO6450670.1 D-alanyl-D-alanine carboxypeptidase family protein [Oceanobacillus profundus]RHW31057.1 carboxypeptidase [Oceanobacillus profundus]